MASGHTSLFFYVGVGIDVNAEVVLDVDVNVDEVDIDIYVHVHVGLGVHVPYLIQQQLVGFASLPTVLQSNSTVQQKLGVVALPYTSKFTLSNTAVTCWVCFPSHSTYGY